ncbi:VWA domain-containing protein, partial [Mycobacterium sp. E2462]|uniref:VWA domain-containing protein n=1 Tax=Mycobacterium sp. E2462 TaxID=1834133 RepID=UPI0012EAFD41
DVPPNRLKAAEEAATQFAGQLTPGVNLGLVAFSGTPYLLVPPTPQHQATIEALKKLDFADSTATGEAIFTALHAISATAVVGGDKPPPARIVLLSDGGENRPSNPSDPHDGVFTAARLAKDEGVQISSGRSRRARRRAARPSRFRRPWCRRRWWKSGREPVGRHVGRPHGLRRA